MNSQCPLCGLPVKLVPAGVSKTTGRSYNAFWACTDPTRTCTFKQPVQAQGAPARAMNNLQTKTNDQKDLDKSTGMVRHGFSIEAYKLGKKLDPITAREITNWVNFVMTGKLFATPSQPTELPTINIEDVGSPASNWGNLPEEPIDPNEIRVESIPF